MYSVLDYGRMAVDGARIDAYARAIARAVKPGAIVVDLGAGSGIFSLLALRAGASHVHAIEPNPAIHLLRDLARENPSDGRVTIHPRASFEVELAERADVLLSDLRGSFPLFDDNLPAVRDARTRLLRTGATIVAERDRLYAAFVESDELWRMLEPGWRVFENRGFSASAARQCVLNNVYNDSSARLAANDVLSAPRCWTEIDYRTTVDEIFEATFETEMARGGTAHGLAVWFETTVHADITLSAAPGTALPYSRMFLPLLEPTRVSSGDRARVTIRVDHRGTRWGWDWEIAGANGAPRAHRQTTFFGTPADATTLVRASSTHCPARSARGDRLLHVLEDMDGERSVAELAERARAQLAEDSPVRAAILDEVRDAVARYAR